MFWGRRLLLFHTFEPLTRLEVRQIGRQDPGLRGKRVLLRKLALPMETDGSSVVSIIHHIYVHVSTHVLPRVNRSLFSYKVRTTAVPGLRTIDLRGVDGWFQTLLLNE